MAAPTRTEAPAPTRPPKKKDTLTRKRCLARPSPRSARRTPTPRTLRPPSTSREPAASTPFLRSRCAAIQIPRHFLSHSPRMLVRPPTSQSPARSCPTRSSNWLRCASTAIKSSKDKQPRSLLTTMKRSNSCTCAIMSSRSSVAASSSPLHPTPRPSRAACFLAATPRSWRSGPTRVR